MRFLFGQLKAGTLIDTAGGDQAVLGPEHDAAVACIAGEGHGRLYQRAANAAPTKHRLDIEHAQLRCVVSLGGWQHIDRAGDLATDIGHPEGLAGGCRCGVEIGIEARDQHFELGIPALLDVVEQRLAMNEPTDIANARGTKHQGGGIGLCENGLDAAHGINEVLALEGRDRIEQRRRHHFVAHGAEARRHGPTFGCQGNGVGAAIAGARQDGDEALIDKPAHHPAQLAAIHVEAGSDLGAGGDAILAQLVDHPRLGEAMHGLVHAFVEETDNARIEAVERANLGNVVGTGHYASPFA